MCLLLATLWFQTLLSQARCCALLLLLLPAHCLLSTLVSQWASSSRTRSLLLCMCVCVYVWVTVAWLLACSAAICWLAQHNVDHKSDKERKICRLRTFRYFCLLWYRLVHFSLFLLVFVDVCSFLHMLYDNNYYFSSYKQRWLSSNVFMYYVYSGICEHRFTHTTHMHTCVVYVC